MKENEEGMEQKERENHFWRLRNFIIGQSLKYSEKGFIQRERERGHWDLHLKEVLLDRDIAAP